MPAQVPAPPLGVLRALAQFVETTGGDSCEGCPNAVDHVPWPNGDEPMPMEFRCLALNEEISGETEDAPCADYREAWFARAMLALAGALA